MPDVTPHSCLIVSHFANSCTINRSVPLRQESKDMTRRRLLFGATAFPLLAAAQKPITGGLMPLDGGKIGNTPPMKIRDIKTYLVGAGGRNWLYVKILTDQDLYGIGEAY